MEGLKISLFLVDSNILLETKKQSILSTNTHRNPRKERGVDRYVSMGDKGIEEM